MRTLLIIFASIAFSVNAHAQIPEPDRLLGVWEPSNGKARVKIEKISDKYYGKIEMLTAPNNPDGTPKKDPNNPKANLRNRDRLGMVIMNGFTWNASEQKWENGTIYDPTEGKTYDGYVYFEGDNKKVLKLRGYVMGMTWLGRTSDWQRIK